VTDFRHFDSLVYVTHYSLEVECGWIGVPGDTAPQRIDPLYIPGYDAVDNAIKWKTTGVLTMTFSPCLSCRQIKMLPSFLGNRQHLQPIPLHLTLST
jgi:hypothetical protein